MVSEVLWGSCQPRTYKVDFARSSGKQVQCVGRAPATPGDARLRDERVFSIASSGENADTTFQVRISQTIVLCQKMDHKMPFPSQMQS